MNVDTLMQVMEGALLEKANKRKNGMSENYILHLSTTVAYFICALSILKMYTYIRHPTTHSSTRFKLLKQNVGVDW